LLLELPLPEVFSLIVATSNEGAVADSDDVPVDAGRLCAIAALEAASESSVITPASFKQ